jgi:hypothetical protein
MIVADVLGCGDDGYCYCSCCNHHTSLVVVVGVDYKKNNRVDDDCTSS